MPDDRSQTPPQESDPLDPLDGEGGGEGIELTVGEPNSFEPEDDPDAAARQES